ncbi:hypothetical protein SFRURICE_013496, partial [Spodoptera frugiperda]
PNETIKQIQRGDVITGFSFNITRDTLCGVRDIANHVPLNFSTCSSTLQTITRPICIVTVHNHILASPLGTCFIIKTKAEK